MSGPRLYTFPQLEGAVILASRLRSRHRTFNYLVEKPPYCHNWRIAIYDTYTGQFVDWLKA
jgi:hypothetical protein